MRLAAAHGSGVRLDDDIIEPAAVENTAVSLVMFRVRGVQAGRRQIEGVGILHDELARAQEAAFGTRLVAKLGLDLIPDLRKLLVAAQLAARDISHDLFVGHAEAEVAAVAVLEAKQVVAHDVPAAGFLPHLGGVKAREIKFLSADGVHFLAHDLRDFEDRALRQIEVIINASGKLADVAGAQQEAMAGDLGFGGVLTEGGDKKFTPVHGGCFVSLAEGASAQQLEWPFLGIVSRVTKFGNTRAVP